MLDERQKNGEKGALPEDLPVDQEHHPVLGDLWGQISQRPLSQQQRYLGPRGGQEGQANQAVPTAPRKYIMIIVHIILAHSTPPHPQTTVPPVCCCKREYPILSQLCKIKVNK